MKKSFKVLLIVLCFSVIFSNLPLVSANNIQITEVDDSEVQQKPEIISEVTSLRTENEKHFKMSDGSFMVASYAVPVHEQNETGEWVDADSSLQGEDGYYETENSDFISREENNRNIFDLTLKNHQVTWEYLDSNYCDPVIEDTNKKLEGDEAFLSLDNVSSKSVYNNLFDNIDLELINNTVGVKENIILNERNTKNEFYIQYKTYDLSPVQVDSKTINLVNEHDEIIYVINAPLMYDSNGETSDNLTLTLNNVKGNGFTLKLSTDADWLNEPQRKFPVTVDPVIGTNQKKASVDSTYVISGKPTQNCNGEPHVLIGKESSGYGKGRAYIKFALPELNSGDMVVDANMNLYQYLLSSYTTSLEAQINAHMVTSSWTESSITWNTQPSFSSDVKDYNSIKASEEGKQMWKSWNITECAKKWYEGTANNGIMLKSNLEDISAYANSAIYAWFYTETGSVTAARPIMQITYRNNKGLESYWTYTTGSAGRAGTAYVNDYSGNLVFKHTNAETTGLRMPITIEHVYNGYMYGQRYSRVEPFVGRGWKMNIQQTLLPSSEYGLTGDSAKTYPYVYTDGDGTEHYFYKKIIDGDPKYFDEDGLDFELVVKSSTFKITDKDKSVMTFNKSGNLTSIIDSNSNKMTISYSADNPNQIVSVKDGAGHVLTIADNVASGSGYIRTITDMSGRVTTFYFTNGYLTRIKYSDNTVTTYEYDEDNALYLATYQDGTGLCFKYSSVKKGKRLTRLVEKGQGTNGQVIIFNRADYNTTHITTSGLDDIIETDDDIITTYQFDNYGRTISKQQKTASYNIGASVFSYTDGEHDSSASNIKQLNRLNNSASVGRNIINYAKNTSAEASTDNWTSAMWVGSGAYTFTRSSAQSYIGKYSFLLNSTAMNNDGRARVYQDFSTSVLVPGNTYTISTYIKTSNIVQSSSNYAYGACIGIYTFGSDVSTYSDYITGTTSTDMDNGWRRIYCTVTIPTGTTSTRVNLAIRNATGNAYFDCIQVDNQNSLNEYNMFENNSLENSSNGMPTSFSGNGLNLSSSGDYISTSVKYNGSQSFKIVGDAKTNKEIYQEFNVKGSENDTYIVSGWAKANAIPETNSSRKFKISIKVSYTDGSYVWKSPANFNTTISDWQYTAQAFTLSDEDKSTSLSPSKITIYLRYYNQANTAYFDFLQLVKEVSQSYTYDSEGNLISVTKNAEQNSTLKYDGDNNLISQLDLKGNEYKYKYDSNKNVTSATSANGVKTSFDYDFYGNATSAEVSSTVSSEYKIRSEAEYNYSKDGISDGAYLFMLHDDDLETTYYNYDVKKGTLTSVEDSEGNITSYTYNSNNDLLTSIIASGRQVSYTYNTDNTLKTISRNNMNYNFAYNKYKQNTQVKVGTQTLVNNVYQDRNGFLTSQNFGNGDVVSYQYNNFGLVNSILKNGSTAYTWRYNNSATANRLTDFVNNFVHDFTYDSTGRLVRQNVKTRNANYNINSEVYATEYAYDLNNNVTKVVNSAAGKTITQKYEYDNPDNLPTKYYSSTNRYIDYYYDDLNRISSKQVTAGDYPIWNMYEYYPSNYNVGTSKRYQTNKIKEEFIDGDRYRYTYDSLGNITKIELNKYTNPYDTFETIHKYYYDSLNQLVRDDASEIGMTTVYVYDNGGNLTNKKFYSYTEAADVTTSTEYGGVSFGYNDSNWTDKMTSYLGNTVTYDEIGNPINYDGNIFSWTGRQLDSAIVSGKNITYKYDVNGIRTSKTVNGVTSNYQYVDGKLYFENKNGYDIYYNYDSFGNLAAIKTKKTGTNDALVNYLVTTNFRGDVEGIYNDAGELLANYKYFDAWGSYVVAKDAQGNDFYDPTHIASLNSIKYRGYYQDSDTGYYYLQSRYYDAYAGRFINADCMLKTPGTSVLSTNMFAYCENNPVNHSDFSGQWFGLDDAIAAGVGAVVGVGSQFVGDLVTSAVSGSWQFSSWQTYVGAGVGGAIGGVATLYGGPVVGAAVGAGSSTLIGQSLENVTGGKKRSVAQIAKNTTIDATIGAVVSKVVPVKVSGITSGRNSMGAVFNSGLTKLGNKTASRMSVKVIGKGVVSSFVSDLGLGAGMLGKSYFENSWEQYNQNQRPTPTGPCYWSAP